MPYSVLTPTFEGIGRRKERENLVCLNAGSVHVAEVRDDGIGSMSYPHWGLLRCGAWEDPPVFVDHDPRADERRRHQGHDAEIQYGD